MLDLSEMQFEILPTAEAAEGVGFGIGLDVSVDNGGFDPGTAEWITQDTEDPLRGHTAFGVDHLVGPTWSWSLHTNRSDVATALESLGVLKTAWRGFGVIDTPGALMAMRYRVGDRVRRVYGRSRRFAAPPDNRILNGLIPITADFKCVDDFTYGDELQSASVSPLVAPGPSLVFPLTFPLAFTPVDGLRTAIVVGGDAPTYPMIRIEGPISEPYLETNNWKLNLDIDLGENDTIDVDLRPWALTVLLNEEISVAGALSGDQWLADMRLIPGEDTLIFGGTGDAEGASALVSWRDAWNSL